MAHIISKAFLASKNLGGLKHVLPDNSQGLRTVFVPTAGSGFESAPWIDDQREWFIANGFVVQDLELATATPSEVDSAISRADVVYVAGGNTYFLLHHVKRTNFWEILGRYEPLYVGSSAGAIICCPDIGFIEDLDDPNQAPQLSDTAGAGIVDFAIMPHMDDEQARPAIDRILSTWPTEVPLVKLNDDQAVVVENASWRLVSSPPGNLNAN